MNSLLQDLRFGARQMARNPGFTAVVVLTLALGIGANTLIFSVVSALLLRPLPFEDPEQLVVVRQVNLEQNIPSFDASVPNYLDWQEQNTSFEEMAAMWTYPRYYQSGGADIIPLAVARVTPNIFACLRIRPEIGRVFLPEDDRPGHHQVILLNHSVWNRKFGGRTDLVGESIQLDGVPFTVVGILPPGLGMFEKDAEGFIPSLAAALSKDRGDCVLKVFARLEAGTPIEAAQAEMRTIAQRLEQAFPKTNTGWSVRLEPLHRYLTGSLRIPLLTLLGAVGFILLIACANVANLLLTRASGRNKEIAIRAALGAGLPRVIRQMLTESTLLGVLGGALGILLAMWGIQLVASGHLPLTAALLQGCPHQLWHEIRLDGQVLAFTVILSILTGVTFGLAPALRVCSFDLNAALKEGSRNTSSDPGRHRHLHPFVVAEIALAMILLAGAGLLIRNFGHLQQVDPGFDANQVASIRLSLTESKYSAEPNRRIAFFDQARERIRAIPGVENVALAEFPPMEQWGHILYFSLAKIPPLTYGEHTAHYRRIGDDYFRILRIPLLKGRFFSAADHADAPPVVIVNTAMARRFWPSENALGRLIYPYSDAPSAFKVVGVVGDEKIHGLGIDPEPVMYFSYRQSPWTMQMSMLIRTRGNPLSRLTEIEKAVHAVDPQVALTHAQELQDLVSASIDRQRMSAGFLSGFALVGLALAALGIYGVMAHAVGQRTHEIGIRMALGARAHEVWFLVLRQGMMLVGLGLGLGWLGALALGRLLSGLLYEVSPTDPTVFAVTPLCLAMVAIFACYLPARRAANIDPAIALRNE